MPLADIGSVKIAVIGLGYVGLPLAAYMARHFPVIGFDIDAERIAELSAGHDRTREVTADEFAAARALRFSADAAALETANFFIVTVPTPIDTARRPDLTALMRASETVGNAIRDGGVVVFESTVYPGCTEEVCVPIIERLSGLKFNRGFFAGYSPERINPGDKAHRFPDILKVTSGSSAEAAALIDSVYSAVVSAGTHKASSIRVAEAAKVIENIQRDVNIALVNELAMLFDKLGLDTREVLAAAGTKWNFHRYTPGLVGGHCIGVDPYYLTHKAQSVGFHTEMILAGRRINDGMATWIAHNIIKTMVQHKVRVDSARILIMGFTFKENVPDTRNTKVADLVTELQDFAADVVIYDPHANSREAEHEYGLTIANSLPGGPFEAIVIAVRHDEIVALSAERIRALLAPGGIIYDIKGVLPGSSRTAGL
ncbi:MAG TPA: nucleotide sugar dehydrogenase [Hyphomicrobiaceae bacterium]|nr:nucleotide sugar dehydrogenase [Hyphomicrobiaceae bacterium]